MNREPTRLMRQEAERLFPGDAAQSEAFLRALLDPPDFAPCALWTGDESERAAFLERVSPAPPDPALDWLPDFVLRLAPGSEPGRDPLHETGALYSLDFSSIWAASALRAIDALQAPRVLDLCAAPGGKSVFASLALRPAFLLSNEVIGKRLAILRHNLGRCRIENAFTQRLDPRDLAEKAPGAFDVVIVDAPCSGQSLLAKGIENPGAFHPATVKGNAKRQAGILTAAAQCVAPGGWMLYSTCTFSERENERVIGRLLDRRPDFFCAEVSHLAPWQSTRADFPAYRLYPQEGIGAGSFACLLQRKAETGFTVPAELPHALGEFPVGSG